MRKFITTCSLLALTSLTLAGCPSDDQTTDASTGGTDVATGGATATGGAAATGGAVATGGMADATGGHEQATGGTDTSTAANCGLPDFALDVEAEGQSFKVKLLAADPAPPVKFYNDWTVEITDLEGNPVTESTAFEVKPFMPAHGHGATMAPVVTAVDGEPGQFLISPVYMWMGGKWDIYFKAPGENDSDAATLYACIPN